MIDVSRLLAQLQVTKLQNKDYPLYQLLDQLIKALNETNKEVKSISGGGSGSTTEITQIIQQLSFGDGDGGGDSLVVPGPVGPTGIQGSTGPQGVIANFPAEDGIDGLDAIPIIGPQGNPGPTGSQGPLGVSIPSGGDIYEETNIQLSSGSGSGKLVQVVNTQTGATATGTTLIPIDDTIPQITEGTEFMTLSITPTNANNKLKIEVVAFLSSSVINWVTTALFQDSIADALACFAAYNEPGNSSHGCSFTHYMTAGTTSPTTFRVRAGGTVAGTTRFNGVAAGRVYGGVLASSITISEIVP